MRTERVEILSDQTNSAVMRHPDRKYPGILLQGDNLYALCDLADQTCAEIGRGRPGFNEANELRNVLWTYLNHYKMVLGEHEIAVPFSQHT